MWAGRGKYKNITSVGVPFGSPEFTTAFVKSKVCLWRDDVLKLSNFASSQPHAA